MAAAGWPEIVWDVQSTRSPEEGRVSVDVYDSGRARARRWHQRWRFELQYQSIPEAEALTLQSFLAANEGAFVELTWRDGRTYQGLLASWDADRVRGSDWRAQATIRGAEVVA